MEFDKILHLPVHWEDLGWDFYTSIFKFVTFELRPLVDIRILFSLNILRNASWILTKLSICIDIDI